MVGSSSRQRWRWTPNQFVTWQWRRLSFIDASSTKRHVCDVVLTVSSNGLLFPLWTQSQEVMYVMLALNSPPIHSPPQPYPFRLYYQSTTAGVSCVTYRLTLKAPLILAPPPACTHTFLYSTCWQQIPVYCQENSSCCWLCLTEQHWLCACMFSKYACGV